MKQERNVKYQFKTIVRIADTTEFGSNLYKARMAAGFSQNDLANAIGCKQPNISYYEKDGYPTAEKLIKICKALNITPNDLFLSNKS